MTDTQGPYELAIGEIESLRAEVAALKARIAELESGQVNAAVEMCRRHCGTETFITVADWLASQV